MRTRGTVPAPSEFGKLNEFSQPRCCNTEFHEISSFLGHVSRTWPRAPRSEMATVEPKDDLDRGSARVCEEGRQQTEGAPGEAGELPAHSHPQGRGRRDACYRLAMDGKRRELETAGNYEHVA